MSGVIINTKGEINIKEQKVANRTQYLQRKIYWMMNHMKKYSEVCRSKHSIYIYIYKINEL
jgi:hypothetical protein